MSRRQNRMERGKKQRREDDDAVGVHSAAAQQRRTLSPSELRKKENLDKAAIGGNNYVPAHEQRIGRKRVADDESESGWEKIHNAKNIFLFDAPFSGDVADAAAGQLTFKVGSPSAGDFSNAESFLMPLAKSVVDCGLAEHTNAGVTSCPLEADGDAVGDTRGGYSFDIFVLASYPPYTAAAEAYLLEKLKAIGALPAGLPVFVFAWKIATGACSGAKWAPDETMATNFRGILQCKPDDDAAKAAELLRVRLNNTADKSDMALAERDEQFGQLHSFLQKYSGAAPKDHGSRGKRGLLTLFSTRGSGKTQLLKNALFANPEPLAKGSILVCDCSSHLFGDEFRVLRKSNLDENAISRFFVNIIKKHVHLVLDKTLACKESSTPAAAVESAMDAWKEACRVSAAGKKFQPMFVFDTTEHLPHMSKVECTQRKDRSYRTVIEAMASMLPKEHGMVAVGCLHVGTEDVDDPTQVTVTRIAVLPPLTLEGYRSSLGPWIVSDEAVCTEQIPKDVTTTMRLLHILGGGVPRLLPEHPPCQHSRLPVSRELGQAFGCFCESLC